MAVNLLGRSVEAIIFDVDGTFYSQEVLDQVFSEARIQIARRLLALNGIEQPTQFEIENKRAQFLDLASELGSFSHAYAKLGGAIPEYRETVETIDRSKYLSPNPKLKSTLQSLKRLVRVGLFTSTTERTTNSTCSKLLGGDWRSLFSAILCCDTPGVTVEKPHSEAFLYILRLLEVSPENTVMVGDIPNADLMPAAVLGMLTVQVERTDYPQANLRILEVPELVEYLSSKQ